MVTACEDMDFQSITKLFAALKNENYSETEWQKIEQMKEYAEQYNYDDIIAVLQKEN